MRLPIDQARLRPHLREGEQADIFRGSSTGLAQAVRTEPRSRSGATTG
jgi:hypothetical protein